MMKSLKTPIVFIDDDEQEIFEETDYLTPETHYSPKDKVSTFDRISSLSLTTSI